MPVSPVISTVESVGATFAISRCTPAMGALVPASPGLGQLDALRTAQEPVLRQRRLVLQQQVDLLEQGLEPCRLEQIVVRAEAQRLDGGLQRAVGGEHDDDQVRHALARLAHDLDAAASRHAQVGDQHVERGGGELLDRFVAAAALGHLVPGIAQGFGHGLDGNPARRRPPGCGSCFDLPPSVPWAGER
ncbi:MAG: hypothetical protein U1E76_09480 [Planctomycetota bacterium]